MTEITLNFTTDAGIIARLGRELVGKQETALTELIKNAYDADATHVDVVLEEDVFGAPEALEIRDNGSGMSLEQLNEGFLRIANDTKVREPRSPRYGRARAGRKGIGRFATERLGRTLDLTTHTETDLPGLRLKVDWDAFAPGRELADVPVVVEPAGVGPHGTMLRIERLRDDWTDAQLRRCLRNVMGLLQPFPVVKVAGGQEDIDPGFEVRFLRGGGLVEDNVIADLQTEILNHAHAVIEARVDSKGCADWRMIKNRFGENRRWNAIHHGFRQRPVPPYKHLRHAAMRAHYFILLPELLPGLVYTRMRDILSDLGGVRLYRNGFRVVPYGDPDNDWLRLDELYAKRSGTLAPIANRNFFGIVEIHDPEGTRFEERTSREGLIDKPAFEELRDLLSSVLVTAINTIAADRGRIGGARGRRSRPQGQSSGAGRARVKVQRLIESTSYPDKKKLEEIDQDLTDVEAEAEVLVAEVEMLRFLASIGMASAEFTHEIRMTFQAFGLEMEAIVGFVRAAANDDTLFESALRADDARARIEAFTGYFSETMASRNLRNRRPVSLKKTVRDFTNGIRPMVSSQNVELEIVVPPMDPLFTTPLHEAEISSILLNLLTNAIKAIKRANCKRLVRIEADREDDSRLRLRFSDTGDSVKPELRDRIFDPFFTTQSAPAAGADDRKHALGTGLGLWIVRQIVDNFDGEIDLVAPPTGFATCFQVIIPDEDADRD